MQKVFVGISGGVDSAVSAVLLKERGYDVTGVFIKIWRPEFTECTWKEDRIDAMRVCAALEIPFREIDLSDEYKHDVVDSMVRDYARGITPNPDVLCNRSIKFGGFAKWAFENGADLIATGHYARVVDVEGKYHLLRGADPEKDQSYFLHLISQENLARTLFPVGEYRKSEVREMAKRFNLPVAQKHDSQGLCFIGDVSINEFLSKFLKLKPGPVVNQRGEAVGQHDGAPLYTIGQRHGFTTRGGEPHFITSINTITNTITVSEHRENAAVHEVMVSGMHWINNSEGRNFLVQARYREKAVAAVVEKSGVGTRVRFETPHIAAPGQSLVVYRDEECLGGGVITPR